MGSRLPIKKYTPLFFVLQNSQTTTIISIMTDKIIIKNTAYEDSRTAPEDITKEKLYEDTE